MKTRVGVLMALAFGALMGCASKSPITEFRIDSSHHINPDIRDRAAPVVVRVYQLRSAGQFQDADFYELYDNAKALLGDDLIAVREMVLEPGEDWEAGVDLNEKTQFVGFLAAFRDIENADWRLVEPVNPKNGKAVKVAIEGLSVKRLAK